MNGTLCNHTGSERITVNDLATIPTPEPTATWKPIPHFDIPNMIENSILARHWQFADPKNKFDLAVTPDNRRLFGVANLVIPGNEYNNEFGLAMGFCNSHDKTLALRLAAGTRVFVCDNLTISGDIKFTRRHTTGLDIQELIDEALGQIPEAAQVESIWYKQLQTIHISQEAGIAYLATAVAAKALPLTSFLDARAIWMGQHESPDPAFHPAHEGTLWAAYQAITLQWRGTSLPNIQQHTAKLHEITNDLLN